MRVVAICAIVAFLAWVSEQALAPPTIADRNIAPAVYAVEQPVASTVAVTAPPSAAPIVDNGPNPVDDPATVDVQPERGVRLQVTPTEPPPVPRPPVNGDCESWRPLLNLHGIPYDGAARIMRRESGCAMVDNYNPSTRDDSLCAFQLNRWGALDAAWTEAGFPRWYMATPEGCVDAAALYYHACGWGPWVKPYDCPGGWPL